MEDQKVTAATSQEDLTAIELLDNDCAQLTQIMSNAFSPLTQMTPLQLSQNQSARENAAAAIQTVNNLLAHLQAMIQDAENINNIKKTVHFQKNAVNPQIQPYKDGVAIVNEDGRVLCSDIVDCDFIFIADHDAVYDERKVTVCQDVHIIVSSEESTRATRLRFWSGGNYVLYHGTSLSQCIYLDRTTTLTLA
jgi:hypothetical protein